MSGGQLLNQDSWKKDASLDAFGSRSWLIGNALKANDLLGIAMSRPDVYGDALHAFLREGATRLGCMNAVCEDERKDENRLELGTGQDAAGMPLARVTYRRSADASRLALQAAAQGDRICKAAGATSAWHSGVNAMHILGGTVMGREPADSVANAQGQAHELRNLYFGGSGLFASSSAVNPTFTVHALALKSARHVVRHWAALVA